MLLLARTWNAPPLEAPSPKRLKTQFWTVTLFLFAILSALSSAVPPSPVIVSPAQSRRTLFEVMFNPTPVQVPLTTLSLEVSVLVALTLSAHEQVTVSPQKLLTPCASRSWEVPTGERMKRRIRRKPVSVIK